MKAKKKPIDIKTLSDIGLDTAQIGKPLIRIVTMKPPPERKGGRMITGDSAQAKVAELVRILHEEDKAL
jgi:electron transfer flavoprotein beta subunit